MKRSSCPISRPPASCASLDDVPSRGSGWPGNFHSSRFFKLRVVSGAVRPRAALGVKTLFGFRNKRGRCSLGLRRSSTMVALWCPCQFVRTSQRRLEMKKLNKLAIKKVTLRNLDELKLEVMAGGYSQIQSTCPIYCGATVETGKPECCS